MPLPTFYPTGVLISLLIAEGMTEAPVGEGTVDVDGGWCGENGNLKDRRLIFWTSIFFFFFRSTEQPSDGPEINTAKKIKKQKIPKNPRRVPVMRSGHFNRVNGDL